MKSRLFFSMLIAASTMSATTIVGISYTDSGCVTTLSDGCAGIGVTNAGSTSNPFLNNLNTKAIDIGYGSYLTFNEPFFSAGAGVTFTVDFSDSTFVTNTFTIPSGVGTIGVLTGGGGTITFGTTSLTADRMSFGQAPETFSPSGVNDTIFTLNYVQTQTSGSPEPGTLGTVGLAAAGLATQRWRRRFRPIHSR
jgi:hypothetical protein